MSALYEPNPDVMHTDLGDELVLVHSRTGHSYRLNSSARLAWLQLPTTPQSLATTLTERFDVDIEVASRDAAAALDHLLTQGLAQKAA